MAWTPFSYEAVHLLTDVERLVRQGRTSDALDLIGAALAKAQREGPSNISYSQFEAEC